MKDSQSKKRRPTGAAEEIRLKNFRAVRQTEGHTCGFCAAIAIYRFYGLSPSRLHLRALLGTDNQALPYGIPFQARIQAWLTRMGWDSKGTLPMDMLAVLYWHRFDTQCRTGNFASYRSDLRRHLRSGHPALALTSDLGHWVVVTGMDAGRVWVVDSLSYLNPDNDRLCFSISNQGFAKQIGGVILVKRDRFEGIRAMTALDRTREYARGVIFGAGCMHKVIPAWIRSLLPG